MYVMKLFDIQKKGMARWMDEEKPKKRPRRKPRFPSNFKLVVWGNYNGNCLDGECWLCGEDLNFTDCECGHIISKYDGGKTKISNLIPLHRKCNSDIFTMSARKYQKLYYPHLVDKPMRSGKKL
jgi:5-methylcytosine-specific restriction endonuclease McrA